MKGYIVETRWGERDPEESEIIYNRAEADRLYNSIDLKEIYNTEKTTAGRAFKHEPVFKALWIVSVDEYVTYLNCITHDVYNQDDAFWFEHHHID